MRAWHLVRQNLVSEKTGLGLANVMKPGLDPDPPKGWDAPDHYGFYLATVDESNQSVLWRFSEERTSGGDSLLNQLD